MAFLVIEKNELNDGIRSVTLENETIIGREKTNAVFIDDSRASRQHAKIIREIDGSYYIIDLGSRNGILVNNEKVSRRKLIPQDRIIIGRTILVFNAGPPPPKADMPMAQGRPEGLSSEAPEKKDLASEIQKIVQDMDTAKEAVNPIPDGTRPTDARSVTINNKTSTKEVSAWVKVLVFISFLLFFIAVLCWAKWAGEKLIAHLTKSPQVENIPSSPPPK